MVWADYLILVILGVSALISIWRGFVREAISLGGIILAFWVALSFFRGLADLLTDYIGEPSLRLAVAFGALVVVTLIMAAVVKQLAVTVVEKVGLSGVDRTLGVLFGVARGMVVVLILVFLAGLTPMPQDQWWHQSFFLPYFQGGAMMVRDLLPGEVASYFRY